MKNFKIFGIDIQNAFVKAGEPLCVPGAPEDNVRIKEMIRTLAPFISDIILTVDTHPVDHIGHPGYWMFADGTEVPPFTFITPEMLTEGKIAPRDLTKLGYATRYVSVLGGTMVWPVHCVPGTDSHKLSDEIEVALTNWKAVTGGVPTIVKKGFHKELESFGIFAPEFEAHEDTTADFNDQLVGALLFGGDPIVVVGEASSHCVKRSVEQLVQRIKDYNLGFDLSKIILLKDCMSPVPNFEAVADKFFEDMAEAGLTITTSKDLIEGAVL
jgi:nicotinamidase-related amidase